MKGERQDALRLFSELAVGQTRTDGTEDPMDRHRLIVTLGERILVNTSPSNLGDSVWDIYYTVVHSAIHIKDFDTALPLLKKLEKKFSWSNRVRCLRGLYCEASGDIKAAKECYVKVLESDESNTVALKRLIAINKGNGDIDSCIAQLNIYLDTFMGDAEAWVELASLYQSKKMWTRRLFCLEEAILIHPTSYSLREDIAETYEELGTLDDLRKARKIHCSLAEIQEARITSWRAIERLCLKMLSKDADSKESKSKSISNKSSSSLEHQKTQQLLALARNMQLNL